MCEEEDREGACSFLTTVHQESSQSFYTHTNQVKVKSNNFFFFFSRRWTTFSGLEFAVMHQRGVGREIINRITWNIRPNHTETAVTKTLKVCLFRAQLRWEKAQRKKVAKSFLFTAHVWYIWAGASAAEATTGDEIVFMFLLLPWMRAVQRRLS